jgi:hypothetical protein
MAAVIAMIDWPNRECRRIVEWTAPISSELLKKAHKRDAKTRPAHPPSRQVNLVLTPAALP